MRPEIPAMLPMNFTLSLEERIRGAVTGVPSWIRRKRLIEDLIERAVLNQREAKPADRDAIADADLARINDLIERHNRWYPIEANLPLDPKTGRQMDRVGAKPWTPMELLTRDDLR